MTGLNWQSARVVSSGNGRALLQFASPEACHRCERGEGCGAGVFKGLFPHRAGSIEVPVSFDPQPDEWVRVGVTGRALALGALVAYGLPLGAFIAGALPAHVMLDVSIWRDCAALAGGLAAAAVAVVAGRRLLRISVNLVVERLSCDADGTKFTVE